VCGEYVPQTLQTWLFPGSPPRERGAEAASVPAHEVGRITPRERGARPGSLSAHHLRRITPACAGNTSPQEPSGSHRWDHPRAYGEHVNLPSHVNQPSGSPPRVRGSRSSPLRRPQPGLDHPRVCGQHSQTGRLLVSTSGSPPRVRGTPFTTCGPTDYCVLTALHLSALPGPHEAI